MGETLTPDRISNDPGAPAARAARQCLAVIKRWRVRRVLSRGIDHTRHEGVDDHRRDGQKEDAKRPVACGRIATQPPARDRLVHFHHELIRLRRLDEILFRLAEVDVPLMVLDFQLLRCQPTALKKATTA